MPDHFAFAQPGDADTRCAGVFADTGERLCERIAGIEVDHAKWLEGEADIPSLRSDVGF